MLNVAIRTALILAAGCFAAAAQTVGTLDPRPLPPLEKPDDPDTPAKDLFGRKAEPANLKARAIGYYTNGCLAGGVAMPVDGENWQAMRLSRNRNWGHPNLIAMLKRLADNGSKAGWHGLLVGDLAQPRGGPMLTGHWSHQVGLDADIWLTPMPDRRLSAKEREEMMATNVVAPDWNDVNPAFWTPEHIAIIKAAATDKEVERVLVNPAIKKALCREVKSDRSWLRKVRPVRGHNYHFHVRISCPADSKDGCKNQPPPPDDDGCGKELDWWFSDEARKPRPGPVVKREPVKLSALPEACRQVLAAPSK